MSYANKNILKLFVLSICAVLLILLIALINKKYPDYFIYYFAIALATFLATFKFIFPELDRWLTGEKAEVEVFNELIKLRPDFFITYDITPSEKLIGNIDVIAVGSTGVWAIEVKSGLRFYNGSLKQARREAGVLSEILKKRLNLDIFVQPVVVMNNPKTFLKFGHNKPDGITYVVKREWINDLVQRYNISSLTQEQISKISNFLEEYKNKQSNLK